MSLLSKKTLAKKLLQNKKFREAYVFEHIKRHIPFQVRTMRTDREWSQAKAGEAIGKPQNVISRLESPAYGKLTLQTLLDIANGFDVGLLIKFVPFSRLVREYEDVSGEALSAKSVTDEDEAKEIERWAAAETATTVTGTSWVSVDDFVPPARVPRASVVFAERFTPERGVASNTAPAVIPAGVTGAPYTPILDYTAEPILAS